MAIDITEEGLSVAGTIDVQEVEALLAALDRLGASGSPLRVDLSKCLGMHTAAVQTLMIRRAEVTAWPEAADGMEWLRAALTP